MEIIRKYTRGVGDKKQIKQTKKPGQVREPNKQTFRKGKRLGRKEEEKSGREEKGREGRDR